MKTMNAKIPGVVKNLEGPATYHVTKVSKAREWKDIRMTALATEAFFVESGSMTVYVYPPEHNPSAFIYKEPEVHMLRSQNFIKVDPNTRYDVKVSAGSKIYELEWVAAIPN